MVDRMIGVLKLDVNTFEEIEHDESATGQAALIVAVVAILAAIGGFFGAQSGNAALQQMSQQFGGEMPIAVPTISPIGGAINAFIAVFISWVVWSVLTYLIGTSLFQGQATVGEMLRVLGFAHLPQVLRVFSFIPCLGALISLVAIIWSLVVGFIAVRQGLDIDNMKTVITIILSWLAAFIINICILAPIFSLIL